MKDFLPTLRKITSDWQFGALVLLLISTNVSILLDMFIIRQALGFLTFTLLPGCLVVVILKLTRLELLKKFLLVVGLGVGFLMFVSLLLNTIYFSLGLRTPLSTLSLVFSLSPIVFALFLIAYRRGRGRVFPLWILRVFQEPKKTAQLLFPTVFPILAIAGTQLMNTTQDNSVLLSLLFLIIGYSITLFVLKPENRLLYPVSLWTISIASILMLSLRSNHIIGYDVYWEYRVSQLTMGSLHWSPNPSWGPVSANLTVGLLPVTYSSLLGIGLEYVYKIVFAIIFSITPLIVFALVRNFMNSRFAFAASLFFIFQSTFAFVSQSNPRTAIAIVFFGLALLVLFERSIEGPKKPFLAILLISCVIFSHYTTTFIFLIILFSAFLGPVMHFKGSPREERVIKWSLPPLCFALMFFWYGQMTGPAFTKGVESLRILFENLGRFFLLESRHEGTMRVMGVGVTSVPDILYSIDYYLMAVIIGIGTVGLAYRTIRKKESVGEFAKRVNPTLVLVMVICSFLLAAMVLLPMASSEYTMDRLWTQMLVPLSGAFVIGCIFLSANKRRKAIVLVGVFLTAHFLASTYLVYQGFGVHRSMVINPDGSEYSHFYVRTEEIVGAQWLKNHMNQNLTVFTDYDTSGRLLLYGKIPRSWFAMTFFDRDQPLNDGYLFLGYYETVKKQVYTGKKFRSIEESRGMLEASNKIYDNAAAEIYS